LEGDKEGRAMKSIQIELPEQLAQELETLKMTSTL
jgi:hypothetical protein